MFTQSTLSSVVISKKIQYKNSEFNALIASFSIHSTLFAITLYLAQTLQKIAQKSISTVPFFEAFTPQASSAASYTNSDTKSSYSPIKPSSDMPNTLLAPSESSSQIDFTAIELIRAMIQNFLVYPAMAKIDRVVVVSFVLTRDARVESAIIFNNSGSSSLDSKAIQTVLALSGEYLQLNKEVQLQIPIAFSLKKSKGNQNVSTYSFKFYSYSKFYCTCQSC
ncbi:MAG: TonB family protein [Campylobacterales bacterium]|nr:TonB family protein [Campylobacterales bacterium]